MPIDYSDPDWRILGYPFPHAGVHYHPKAAEAFAGSNKGFIVDSHYLYGLITGVTVEQLAGMTLSTTPGEIYQPGMNFESVKISERSIRTKINIWKRIISSRPEFLSHIFN
ncbi:hypothetical protein FPZ54_06640 [Sphingomonas suaedae]|uniref:Uncharacterized protein n=1 Tax=Sphingomonas suaedae TaxID=2599297 RepID=A0A518RE63_9SPHN|nr:hypothetical protein [Sphingomonas suaedae]QDX25726.1 hypothetical protein FPZ54_06640 [Sphingomonas suaedae]